jgi:hypothetical protein
VPVAELRDCRAWHLLNWTAALNGSVARRAPCGV